MSEERLFIAAIRGNVGEIRQLLSDGANPNCIAPIVGHSPLYCATFGDHVEAMRVLLENGADPNLRLDYQSPVDGRAERQVVALMYARSSAAVKVLLEAGADVRAVDANGRTPLICAIRRGNDELVQILLDAHAFDKDDSITAGAAINEVDSAIAKYRSWGDPQTNAALNQKLSRLTRIRELLD